MCVMNTLGLVCDPVGGQVCYGGREGTRAVLGVVSDLPGFAFCGLAFHHAGMCMQDCHSSLARRVLLSIRPVEWLVKNYCQF
jgi:hypothetical protein